MLKIMTIICFVTITFIFLFMAYLLDNKDKWYINADGQNICLKLLEEKKE